MNNNSTFMFEMEGFKSNLQIISFSEIRNLEKKVSKFLSNLKDEKLSPSAETEKAILDFAKKFLEETH